MPLSKHKQEAIYHRRGFDPDDVMTVRPNGLLLRGIEPPAESAGGIVFPGRLMQKGTGALMFTVVKVGLVDAGKLGPKETAFTDLKPGDVVIPRHGNLDPIGLDDWPLCFLDVRDVLAVVERA